MNESLADRITRLHAAGRLDDDAVARAVRKGLLPEEADTTGKAANAKAIRQALRDSIADNKAFLAIASPTAAQRNAQVERSTRQMNRVLRILLDDMTGTD